jgi:hypothetical protein
MIISERGLQWQCLPNQSSFMTKNLLLLLVLFFYCNSFFSQLLPNGDMEIWTNNEPDNWISNVISVGNFADPEDFSEITGNPGSALHVWNALGTRSSVSFDLDGYQSFSGLPAQLTFDYRMSLAQGEYVYLNVSLYDAGYTLKATANAYMTSANNAVDWQELTTDFYYYASANPVALISVNVSFASAAVLQSTSFFDFDNIEAVGEAVFVFDPLIENDWSVYPIPANDILVLESKLGMLESYELLTMSGQIAKSNYAPIFGRELIDLTNLSNGIYFLRMNANGHQNVRKVQVTH